MFNVNGPGFHGLYAGDSVEYWHRCGELGNRELRTARVLPLLVFADHVQVAFLSTGYTVDRDNFVRLVRRGKHYPGAVIPIPAGPPQYRCKHCGALKPKPRAKCPNSACAELGKRHIQANREKRAGLALADALNLPIGDAHK